MHYNIHINRPSRKVTIHESTCPHWKKHVGTSFNKLGTTNSYYFPSDPSVHLNLAGAKLAASVWKNELRFEVHECAHCTARLD